jgi:CHAT domain-containing protein
VTNVRHRNWLLMGLGMICSLLLAQGQPGLATLSFWSSRLVVQARDPMALVQQGKALFEAGQAVDAIAVLQRAAQAFEASGDRLRQGITLSNLALVYQSLGQFSEANQMIAVGVELVLSGSLVEPVEHIRAQAQVFTIQGRIQLAQGQAEAALATWQQATTLYEQIDDTPGLWQSQLNQAQALQALGLYRRAIELLMPLAQTMQPQPNSLLKSTVLRSWGEALQIAGDLAQAEPILKQSLRVAEQLDPSSQSAEAVAAAALSLGNLTWVQALTNLSLSNLTPADAIAQLSSAPPPAADLAAVTLAQRRTAAAQAFVQASQSARQWYQRAEQQASLSTTRVQSRINQLRLLIAEQQWLAAQNLASQLQTELATLSVDRTSVNLRIDLALSWMAIGESGLERTGTSAIPELLTTAIQQATSLGDIRTQSFATGTLAAWLEPQQPAEATSLTQQALLLAQSIDAKDIAYRWQWQLGRLLAAQGNRAGAIAAYSEAIQSLQALRNDLVAINREVQFSFRDQVEPAYRELVSLLLQAGTEPSAAELVQARQVIEGLQIAELDNFFREACLETQFEIDRVVDQANLSAAIFYAIVLPDRLEVVLKLPQQALRHYEARVAQTELEVTVDTLLTELKRPYTSQRLRSTAQQVYEWLIRPAEADLAAQPIETLVFVLDGALRSIPVAALYDGQHYLIENYSVALAPGLQLPDPKPLRQRFRALIAGLSEARANFAPLNYVAEEVQQIEADIPSTVLLNQSFTRENFRQELSRSPVSIVHVATHGQFSSNAAETFILAWDSPINVNELSQLLQGQEVSSPEPIELLVLSACRTAVGDRRATLGMAGVAVRAGARSTIASLWNVDDNSGATLMGKFYEALVQNPISKAEALRQAQRALLADPLYTAPRYWAPFVLLGNWL